MAELPPLAPSDRTLVHDQIAEFRSQSGLSEADVRGALARHA